VDELPGIAPAIAIKQKNSTRNPRSTVATATEIYDYLRCSTRAPGAPIARIADTKFAKIRWTKSQRAFWRSGGPSVLLLYALKSRRTPLAKKPQAPADPGDLAGFA